jgi:UDP-N-acetylglucosamine--N-acetylmuramyl-(pentapeptide) pyrophosphoryl-undecaprenol N-acetylglucosamine transferase
MRVILAGGGTGGHLFPGLAVAREFQRRDDMTSILFIGTAQGIEARVLPREGYQLAVLSVRGLKGRGARGVLQAAYGVPASLWRCLKIIGEFRPDVVIGLGGYASGPMLLAAVARRIPRAIMEQNLRPGFTNKLMARFVDRVFTSYAQSVNFFSRARVLETGNPVRWRSLPAACPGEKFTFLVFGGSAGARRINFAVVDALKLVGDLARDLKVIHQTGHADYAAIKEAYGALECDAEVTPFIDEMDAAYARADLILCRAGATTVAEITAFGKAAILVPYPYAIYDHQRGNAEALAARGAAELLLDQQLTGDKLAARLRFYFGAPERLAAMARAARVMGRPEAAQVIVDECYALARR